MTTATRDLLETFDRLPKAEQHEVATEILKRLRNLEYPPLDDDSLARIADESFQAYDAREAADAQG